MTATFFKEIWTTVTFDFTNDITLVISNRGRVRTISIIIFLQFILNSNPIHAQTFCLDRKNNAVADINFQGLFNIDSTIKNKSVFFGEYHEIYGLPEIKYELITQLNQRFGHKDVIMEIGISAAFLYNKFLETGDTNFITKPRMAFVKSKSELLFWQKLYQYNVQQPNSKKIVIHGFDFERSELIKFISLQLPNDEPPQSIKPIIDSILKYKNTKFKLPSDFWAFHKIIENSFTTYDSVYKNYLGEKYELVKKSLSNKFAQFNVRQRNKFMFSYLKNEPFYKNQVPFICFMGEAHTVKYENSSFYNLIENDNDGYRIKSMTISIIVKDLQQRGYSKSQKKNTFGYEYFKKFDDKVCDYLFTKFSNDCKCCLINSMEVPLKNLADFSDYILLMTDKKTED